MAKPSEPKPSSGTNFLTYLVVGATGLGIVGFAYLLFGQQLIVALAVCLVVGGVGGMHYLLWGRALSAECEQRKRAPAGEQPQADGSS